MFKKLLTKFNHDNQKSTLQKGNPKDNKLKVLKKRSISSDLNFNLLESKNKKINLNEVNFNISYLNIKQKKLFFKLQLSCNLVYGEEIKKQQKNIINSAKNLTEEKYIKFKNNFTNILNRKCSIKTKNKLLSSFL